MADSMNPVFVNFSTLDGATEVTFGGEKQRGAEILSLIGQPEGAKQGYGIGYAGTPVAANISWDGPNIPFGSEFQGIPWGRAVLCIGAKKSAVEADNTDPEHPVEAAPAELNLTALDATHIHGTCYGTTVKDCSIQLNCGFSVAAGHDPVPSSDKSGLFIAVMANASFVTSGEGADASEVLEVGTGETVVAVSEAIDPTVLNLATGTNLQFNIPDATGGFTFTARGTLAKAPFVRRVSDYTSFKDKVTSFPTSQAILDAKITALSNT